MTDHIRSLVERAHGLAARDPKAALNAARQVAEAVCQDIYQRNRHRFKAIDGAIEPLGNTVGRQIHQLTSKGLIPPEVAAALDMVRREGNKASHDRGTPVEVGLELESTLAMTDVLLQWIVATRAHNGTQAAPIRPRSLRRPIFGRDGELAALRTLVDMLSTGPEHGGRAIVLAGASGVGKTSVAEATLDYAEGLGFRAVRVSCETLHEGLSFHPIRECLRQLASSDGLNSDIGNAFGIASSQLTIARLLAHPDVDPGARRDALIATFSNLIFARVTLDKRPIAVFVDDMERIDVGSADAMVCLLARLREAQVLVVCAYRTDIVPASGASRHPLQPFLSAVRRAETLAHRVDLEVLPEKEMAGLVETLLGKPVDVPQSFLRRLFEETEGNPLYVDEALRTLSEQRNGGTGAPLCDVGGVWRLVRRADSWEIPRSVDDAIASRMVSLSEEDRVILELAAVAGRRFRFELLADLIRESEDALIQVIERQMDGGLLRELGGANDVFEFTHARLRDVLYNGMSGLRRSRAHGQVGDILLRRRDLVPAEQFDVIVGGHLLLARRYDAAAPLLLQAADRALQLHAPSDAAQHARRALEALERVPNASQGAIDNTRLMLGVALKGAGEFVAAEAQLLLLRSEGSTRAARRWALNHLGDISRMQGRIGEALGHYQECETLARDDRDNELLAETAADLAELHMHQSEQLAGLNPQAAAEHTASYERYLALEQAVANDLMDRTARARAFRNAAKRQRALGNLDEAVRLYQASVALVDGGVYSHQFLIPYAKALRLVDRSSEALEIVRNVLSWSQQIGARRSEAIAYQYLGLILMEQTLYTKTPDFSAAAEALARAASIHGEVGYEQGSRETEVDLAELSAHQRQHDIAVEHLRRAVLPDADRTEGELAAAVVAQLRANGEASRANRLTDSFAAIGIAVSATGT